MSNDRAESSPMPLITALLFLGLTFGLLIYTWEERSTAAVEERWKLCVQQCQGSAVLITVNQSKNSGCLCIEGSPRVD